MHHTKDRKQSTLARSRKPARKPHSTPEACQKSVIKRGREGRESLDTFRLKNNLGQMVTRLSVGGKVQAYEQIAARLSTLAGLSEERAWGWRYVVSVQKGTVAPSKKFKRVFALLIQNIRPRQKQWFYFARRRSVAAIYDKSILQEMINSHMRELGYKPVKFSRYAELKRRKA